MNSVVPQFSGVKARFSDKCQAVARLIVFIFWQDYFMIVLCVTLVFVVLGYVVPAGYARLKGQDPMENQALRGHSLE